MFTLSSVRSLLFFALFLHFCAESATPQLPDSGEITVQLIQRLDSMQNPSSVSQGVVTKSTNPAVPKGSQALMRVVSDSINGGYSVQLVALQIGGQRLPAASSNVQLAPDLVNKMREHTRAPGTPADAVSGNRVFLPEKMIVQFTLTAPSQQSPSGVIPRGGPKKAAQSPEQSVWDIGPVAEVGPGDSTVMQNSARFRGTVTSNGRTVGAALVMHCDFPGSDYPGLLPLEVILSSELGAQSLLSAGTNPIDVSDFGRSQLGNNPAIRLNVIGQNRTTGARYRFYYGLQDMQEIITGAGQTLHLSLSGGTSGEQPITAMEFKLPADAAPVQQIMNSCIEKGQAEEQTRQASIVASCPAKEGDVLNQVLVKYADTNKDVKGDFSEMDNGASWNLPVAPKGRSARKMVMTCLYRKAGSPETQGTSFDQATVPIPVSARSCSFMPELNDNRNSASCTSIAPAKPGQPAEASSGGTKAVQVAVSPTSSRPASAETPASSPSGPTSPVNRLNIRGISVRMGRAQIVAAANAAHMKFLINTPQQLKLADQTANGQPVGGASGSGGSGLVLLINFKDDKAITIFVNEQGDMDGHVFEDIQKKWGAPKGKDQVGPYWGDLNGIYADYDGNMYGMFGMHLTIYDKAAFAAPPKRQPVPM